MNAAAEGRRWLTSAEQDLEFARFSADGGYAAQACFAAQQSAEKAVKALHYVPTRYPNGLDEGTPAEAFSAQQAVHAIECAASIVAAANDHLHARPLP